MDLDDKKPPRQRQIQAPKKVWRTAFLSHLAAYGVVTHAAEAAGVDHSTVYAARLRDPKFAAAWDDALEQATDALEREARRRAFDCSDTLLIFLLKGARPHKYRDNYRVEHSGPDGGAIAVEYVNDWRPKPGGGADGDARTGG